MRDVLTSQYARIVRTTPRVGIKWLYAAVRSANGEDLVAEMRALRIIETLTPREIICLFPPTKTYDGERYERKDYFTTMEAANAHGLDKPLADNALNFLWDYKNPHTSNFLVHLLSHMDNLRKAQTGRGMMEEWCETNGIETYRTSTEYGREVIISNKTGKSVPVERPKKRVPRWWKVITNNAG